MTIIVLQMHQAEVIGCIWLQRWRRRLHGAWTSHGNRPATVRNGRSKRPKDVAKGQGKRRNQNVAKGVKRKG